MLKHIHTVSKQKLAPAQDGSGIAALLGRFDITVFISFVIGVLTALDGLFQRKATQPN